MGKFEKQDLRLIQKNWKDEMDRFLEAQGDQLKLEDLPHLFDRLKSILDSNQKLETHL